MSKNYLELYSDKFADLSVITKNALTNLIMNLYDTQLEDMLSNKTYGVFEAEKTAHYSALHEFFKVNPQINGKDKSQILTEYHETYFLANNPTFNPTLSLTGIDFTELNTQGQRIANVGHQQFISENQDKRENLLAALESKEPDELMAIYLLFNKKCADNARVAKEDIGPDKLASISERRDAALNLLTNDLESFSRNTINAEIKKEKENKEYALIRQAENPSEEVLKALNKSEQAIKELENIKKAVKGLNEYERNKNEIKANQSLIEQLDANTKQTEIAALNSKIAIVQAKMNEELFNLLEKIALDHASNIRELEDEDWWIEHGRNWHANPFSMFCGTTLSGALVIIGLELQDPFLLGLFVILAVPLFFWVWIANYYLTKNIAGNLIRDFIKQGFPKGYKDKFLYFISFFSTMVSCIYTGYATYYFLRELIKEIGIGGGKNLAFEILASLGVIGIIAGIFTFVAYFAVVYKHSQMFSMQYLKDSFKEVGDLAVMADISWLKVLGTQVVIKLILGSILLGLAASGAMPALLNISLIIITTALSYTAVTLLHYFINKTLGNNQRIFSQVQLGFLLFFSLASIVFLMIAAAPMLTPLVGGYVGITLGIVLLSWMGVVALYTMSTIESFKQILKKNNPVLTHTVTPALVMKLKDKTNDKTAMVAPPRSLIEQFWEVVKVCNAAGNGIPIVAGVLETGTGLGLHGSEIGVLATTVFIYGGGISYACNYNGIEADKTNQGKMAAAQDQRRWLQQVRLFYMNIPAAQNKIAAHEVLNTTSDKEKTICKKMRTILEDLRKSSESSQTLSTQEIDILKNGQLKDVYESVEPFINAANKAKQTISILENLESSVEGYLVKRDGEGTFRFADRTLWPAFAKSPKLIAAKKLQVYILELKKCLKGEVANFNIASFTPEDRTCLTQGRLGDVFKKVERELSSLMPMTPSANIAISLS